MKQVYLDFLLLVKETKNRWKKDTPLYFKIVAVINVVASLLILIPGILIDLKIILAPEWAQYVSYGVTFGLWWAAAQNKLVVSRPTNLPLTEHKQEEKKEQNEISNI